MKPYNEQQTKKEQVEQMFDNIASTYDRLNHILSFNIDRLWRRRVVRLVRRSGAERIMDMATGTGDLAIAMARSIEQAQILGVDLSEEMLTVARHKVERAGLAERITLEKGDAENLANVEDGVMDAATVAFGVRNFEHLERGLKEFHRTLRSGGRLIILEFSIPRNALVRSLYGLYSHHIMPLLGALISKDRAAYTYLPDSIEEFPSPERVSDMLYGVGFSSVRRYSLSMGIAHIYEATK